MTEAKKRQIPTLSDKKVMDCINKCDGSENSTLYVLKMILHLLGDIRVFLRIVLARLPKKKSNSILIKPPCDHNITFYNNNNGQVGELEWNDGIMKFHGKADESAKILFDFLKPYIDDYIKDKNNDKREN